MGNLKFVIGFLDYDPPSVAESRDDDGSYDLLPVIVGSAAGLCLLLIVIITIMIINARHKRKKTVSSAYLEARLSQHRRAQNGRYVTGNSLRQNGHLQSQESVNGRHTSLSLICNEIT